VAWRGIGQLDDTQVPDLSTQDVEIRLQRTEEREGTEREGRPQMRICSVCFSRFLCSTSTFGLSLLWHSARSTSLLFIYRSFASFCCARLIGDMCGEWVVCSCGRSRLWSRDYAAAMNIGASLRFFLNFGRWDPDFRSSADEKRLLKAQMPAAAAVQ